MVGILHTEERMDRSHEVQLSRLRYVGKRPCGPMVRQAAVLAYLSRMDCIPGLTGPPGAL